MSSEAMSDTGKSLAKPQTSDCALAAAVHVSSIFWPLLGPIVGWVVFRKRYFVASHARQALTETILLNAAVFLAFVASTTYTVFRIVHYIQTDWKDFSWQEFVLRFLIGWIAFFLLELANTLVSIRQAWRAFKGDWPRRVAKEMAAKA